MHKKPLIGCISLAAFVVFTLVPAATFASPELTFPTGTRLAAGSAITADGVGHPTMTTSAGSTTCTAATMSGDLKTNSGARIEGEVNAYHFTGTEAGGDCGSYLGRMKVTSDVSTPWCLRTTKVADQFELVGGQCGSAKSIYFILHMGGLVCKYERAAAITGTYATHPTDAVLTAATPTFSRVESSLFCPASTELHLAFTLTREGAQVYIS